ncbi:hypothetical protein CATMQ487_23750 [Sphaerotilus microaerophilus]|uniref:Uncharacterized protein n=1 Tax=Sphaerotilus microaerophilus TaxID=2914710 RepID=A0ABN6PJZ2_9BURK|nr:hypothetical protein CATMQ487_23750 [Sphaerotilus sp. FB-5]
MAGESPSDTEEQASNALPARLKADQRQAVAQAREIRPRAWERRVTLMGTPVRCPPRGRLRCVERDDTVSPAG